MKTETIVRRSVRYTSDVMPEVYAESPKLGSLIEWADSVPKVWAIVTRKGRGRSVAWGPKSSQYMGWAQGSKSPDAILERVRQFKHSLEGGGFFGNSARFTLDWFGSPGFTGGFFQEFDERYSRGCVFLDYLPQMKERIIERFLDWCSAGYDYHTQRVEIDSIMVWQRQRTAREIRDEDDKERDRNA